MPFNFKRVGYQPITAPNVPSLAQWRKAIGPIAGDPILLQIDEFLDSYQASQNRWDRRACLGQLYFLTDNWLRRASRSQPGRGKSVEKLFRAVVNKLCENFQCSVNVLPQKLIDYWGRVLTPHGHGVDTQGVALGASPVVADYLDASQRMKFRISFEGSLAYMIDRTHYHDWVLADSRGIGWEDARGVVAPQMMLPGFAGFALSMGRELYMAHHKGCFNEHNFFHSSYLGGDSVLCTGTILIENGRVRAIRNDSGHYQPTIQHLINVVRTFQMHGVDLSTVWVQAVGHSWTDDNGKTQYDDSPWVTGEFLAQNWRGYGWGLFEQRQANRANVKAPMNKLHFPNAPPRRC